MCPYFSFRSSFTLFNGELNQNCFSLKLPPKTNLSKGLLSADARLSRACANTLAALASVDLSTPLQEEVCVGSVVLPLLHALGTLFS